MLAISAGWAGIDQPTQCRLASPQATSTKVYELEKQLSSTREAIHSLTETVEAAQATRLPWAQVRSAALSLVRRLLRSVSACHHRPT